MLRSSAVGNIKMSKNEKNIVIFKVNVAVGFNNIYLFRVASIEFWKMNPINLFNLKLDTL